MAAYDMAELKLPPIVARGIKLVQDQVAGRQFLLIFEGLLLDKQLTSNHYIQKLIKLKPSVWMMPKNTPILHTCVIINLQQPLKRCDATFFDINSLSPTIYQVDWRTPGAWSAAMKFANPDHRRQAEICGSPLTSQMKFNDAMERLMKRGGSSTPFRVINRLAEDTLKHFQRSDFEPFITAELPELKLC